MHLYFVSIELSIGTKKRQTLKHTNAYCNITVDNNIMYTNIVMFAGQRFHII